MNEACDCLYHVKQIICKLLHGMLHHGSVFQLHVNIVTFLLATEAPVITLATFIAKTLG